MLRNIPVQEIKNGGYKILIFLNLEKYRKFGFNPQNQFIYFLLDYLFRLKKNISYLDISRKLNPC